MDLNKILYAIEVSKTGSFSKAASRLYISQPAISKSIADLENDLGFEIFIRTSSGCQTTPKGLEFLLKCYDLIGSYNALEREYMNNRKLDELSLRVSSQHYNFIVSSFIKLINKYKEDNFKFFLKESTSLEAIEHVEKDYSDLAFIYINSSYKKAIFSLFKDKKLTYKTLANVKPHVFLRNNHPLANNNIIKVESLYDYPMIIYEQDETTILPEEFTNLPGHKQIIYTKDKGTTLSLIANSNAFNLGTGCIDPYSGFANIKSIQLYNPENLSMDIGYIYKSSHKLSPLSKEFIELTKNELINCLPENSSLN
ncbi:LysR family transcriptional regulator [uncultured Anaerococcus sp.]|uniref:LysR family transcriptional regulator n=1 Tax=uncultured Anaerococcus sp. TaxID=293428 RepID=UPI002611CE07|nr:LysR family transcriptional regulator [uncultured Anaerococcus sp.]